MAPRAHWVLLVVGTALVGLLLLIHGFTAGDSGDEWGRQSPAPSSAPTAATSGPVLNTSDLSARGLPVAPFTIALTFDDGPTEETERILDVLDRHRVPATFFVVGAQVAEHPEIVRRMMAGHHEVGVHSFTHPDLGSVPDWRESLEVNQTQQVIAAATGYTTNLLRLPFSDHVANLSANDRQALRRAPNYWAVFTDIDTRDWERPGVASIVAAVAPQDGAGAVVMMHDGGGDRTQTVQALDILIPALQAQGYRFTTVTDAVGLPTPFHPATATDRLRGAVVTAALTVADWVASALSVIMIIVAALSAVRLVLLLFAARRHDRGLKVGAMSEPPTVSVVIPAYNESVGIGAAVRSVAASDYPFFDIVVVDDGSTDETSAIVEALDLPRVRVIRQANGGKPRALNTGIEHSGGSVLVLMDGDTVFEPGTLSMLVRQFADPTVGAISGNTKVGNRSGLLGRWQHIEYVMGFNLDRRMYDILHCMPTVPGAIGAFRRQALEDVGGVSADTLAEDTDLTMAVCRAEWRVAYEPDAVAWTEAPSTLGQLWRQRHRWCFGTMQAMWKHRRAVVERGASGRLGRRGMPYLLLFQVLLPVLAPIVDIAALYSLFFQDSRQTALVWLTFLLLQAIAAWYAFSLDRESPRPLWALATQQVVYRQLMYLVVIQSLTDAVAGLELRWQKLRRIGNITAPDPAAVGPPPRR